MRALLDVNVLIALLDGDHVHHGRARSWLRAHAAAGWASCPLTQNGCVRIMSQAGYPNPLPTVAVLSRLADAAHHSSHEFWPDDVSLLDPGAAHRDQIHGARQVTDLYLVALAIRHKGRLATFDGSIPFSAIVHATRKHLVVI